MHVDRAEPGAARWCRLALVGAAVLLSAAGVAAQRRPSPGPSVDLVVLDVVVTDGKGNPIPDLTAADFRIREDGRAVDIRTFHAVNVLGRVDPGDGRTVALLLDDSGVPALGTTGVQQLARAVLSVARAGDEVSVVRLHSRTDEAYGDMVEALDRIGTYRGGARPYIRFETQTDALRQIAAISRQLAITEERRKAIVCLGAQPVCDVPEPLGDAPRQLWDAWVDAVTAAARVNAAVYAIVPGRTRPRGGGIVEATGGLTYGGFSDFREPIVAVWNDTSTHYLLGYWPSSASRELHKIDVSVNRPKVRIRARERRGE